MSSKDSSEILVSGLEVGSYRLLDEIGCGGMGTVYRAERIDGAYRKQVAVKLMRPSVLGEEDALARFRQERQILATIEYPHIARLLDGGTTQEGVPYLVMELVEGQPIDQYCDEYGLSLDERLNLFLKVCGAVQVAHQNLVIHRDLKPNNILVAEGGEPKLIDFGIAKPIAPEASGGPREMTERGLFLGAPEYASPEQFQRRQLSTATDVYALGVLLYKLLTGTSSRYWKDLSQVPWHEGVRMVCDEDPRSPSSVVSTRIRRNEEMISSETTSSETKTSEPSSSEITPRSPMNLSAKQFKRRLRGDLDNIVLKALRKSPEERYRSVEHFADDVEAHLSGLPVSARKPTFRYHAGKFVRRHAGAVVAAFAFVVLLVAFSVAMTLQRNRAKAEAAKVMQVNEFMQEILTSVNPFEGLGAQVTVVEALEAAEQRISSLDDQPEIQAVVQTSIGISYRSLGLLDKAEEFLEAALKTRKALFGEDHLQVGISYNELGVLRNEQGRHQEAESLFRLDLEIRNRLKYDRDIGYAITLDNLAITLANQMELEEARRLHEESLTIKTIRLGQQDTLVAAGLNNLAETLYTAGDYDASLARYQQALDIFKNTHGEESMHFANTLQNLSNVHKILGDLDSAEALSRKALELHKKLLGDMHPNLKIALSNYAVILELKGQYDEAEEVHRQALRIARQALGSQHPGTARAINNLASVLQSKNDIENSETLLLEALDIFRTSIGDNHDDTATTYVNLAINAFYQQDYLLAEKRFVQAVAIFRKILGEDHIEVGETLMNYGLVLHTAGRTAEGEKILRQSLEIFGKKLNDEHPHLATNLDFLGAVLVAQEKYEEAENILRRALEIRLRSLGEEHPRMVESWNSLAGLLRKKGRFDDAGSLYVSALDLQEKLMGKDETYGMILGNMAYSKLQAGDPSAAEAMFRESLDILETASPSFQRSRTKNRYGRCLTSLGRFEAAQEWLSQGYDELLESLGSEHQLTREAADGLAELHEASKKR